MLIYCTTLLSPHFNWLVVKNLDSLNSYCKYIYSMYFSATTMLTVGYGDIAPVNVI